MLKNFLLLYKKGRKKRGDEFQLQMGDCFFGKWPLLLGSLLSLSLIILGLSYSKSLEGVVHVGILMEISLIPSFLVRSLLYQP